MSDNCIFCSIIGEEISSTTIYEDSWLKVIMDIAPAASGHAIIISKKHCSDIFELDDETASRIFTVARKIAKGMKEELNCDGINILQNNGKAAGQTVFHFHVHVIPRYENDSIKMTWNNGSYKEGEMERIAKAISNRISTEK